MNVSLHLRDCLSVLPTLEAGSVDAIITDLPYGTTACAWDTVIPFAPMWEQVKRLLKPRGAFVTTASQPFTSALVMSNTEWFKYALVWEKEKGTGHLDAHRRPLRVHEDIIVFYAAQPIYNAQFGAGKSYIHRTSNGKAAQVYNDFTAVSTENNGKRFPKTIIRFKNDSQFMQSVHPTQKPVALYAYLIRTYTNAGDTVLDFCMGSGTTGVAAVKEGRDFVGVELDEDYFKIAEKRIAEAQYQLPLLELA